MLLINFSHPLDPDAVAACESSLGQPLSRAPIEVQHLFDVESSFVEQAKSLVETVGLSPQEWQRASLIVNLPPLSLIAALVLAEIHGRRGEFPRVLRMKRNAQTEVWEFAELVSLQNLRDEARQRRF